LRKLLLPRSLLLFVHRQLLVKRLLRLSEILAVKQALLLTNSASFGSLLLTFLSSSAKKCNKGSFSSFIMTRFIIETLSGGWDFPSPFLTHTTLLETESMSF